MDLNVMFESFPTIYGNKLFLDKIGTAHLDEVFSIYSNDRVFEYCGIIPKHNIETVKNMIGHFERDYNKRSRVKWGISPHDSPDKLVGIIEAFDFNQKVNMVTIGYFLEEASWGKGIATEAVGHIVDYLFQQIHVNRIQAEVMLGNDTSKRVLIKNGFMKEGTLRQASLWSGKGIVDLELYAILKDDYSKYEGM
ncbi:GNAT family N-acetyltransferase [Paenibacillus sp. TRM 82003]|nr:GNAT family N-acetyltransferase [Paenibacillus sp. TRM 82003]